MDTYRYHGHSMSDPGSTYRSREEISGVRQQRDPVERIKQLIFHHQIMSQDEVKAIEKEQRKKVDDAIEEGKQGVEPGMSELAADMYAKPLTQHVRGVEYEQRYPMAQAA
jgi:pyruvate dehydrogenase E1 component alpha subunit